MAALTKQVVIGGLEDPAEEALGHEAAKLWREQLYSAIRTFVIGYIAHGQKGYEACAIALDRCWGPEGRPVSASSLRAALQDSERNNFRAEWLYWFASQDADVAAVLARQTRPAKTDAERLADLEAELREELSHKRAEQVLRRARAR